jgi:hypothetical protein
MSKQYAPGTLRPCLDHRHYGSSRVIKLGHIYSKVPQLVAIRCDSAERVAGSSGGGGEAGISSSGRVEVHIGSLGRSHAAEKATQQRPKPRSPEEGREYTLMINTTNLPAPKLNLVMCTAKCRSCSWSSTSKPSLERVTVTVSRRIIRRRQTDNS